MSGNWKKNSISSPLLPDYVVEKVRARLVEARILQEQAQRRIPEQYHDFLVMLKQTENVYKGEVELTPEQKSLGLFCWNGNTYLNVHLPYVSVNGRVLMARDEHREKNAKMFIHPATISPNSSTLTVKIDSEIHGSACGTATIFWDGSGANKTNPVENAETSAIGRALGFLGYGLVGTGIASAEEIEIAMEQSKPDESRMNQNNISTHQNRPQLIPVKLTDLETIIMEETGEHGFVLRGEFNSQEGPKETKLLVLGELINHPALNVPAGTILGIAGGRKDGYDLPVATHLEVIKHAS
jgi:hypothetical protein